ncbi:NADH:flavin oxidoreductase/NADH oxidase [Diaminobutyricimonas sp. TR449]|uniref:NADH:flavin oxidoreductase/NADH oxidase n=1 Tax=Diaminobutyricimonas sp. TR449 TaxID=2708076 RepID=UPI00141DBDEA|nr:NADH:flavin oxidoreductase/NADH oxidase [Diaminobutyricimonas sp. TR449]
MHLFSPLSIRQTTLRNRIWVSPMCQYSAVDGMPNTWHLVHLGSFATGGAGLIFTEATAVLPEGRIAPEDAGIWSDAHRDAWAPLVDFVHAQGGTIGMQLGHAGRKASSYRPWSPVRGTVPAAEGGWTAMAPSAVPFGRYDTPTPLTQAQVAEVVEAFRRAARRALDAGFDVLEVHGAHGYLIHQFLSPLANDRNDEYGGSLENRARLLLEVVAAVRAEAGEKVPLFVRLSATDWAEDGGWDVEQTSIVAGWAQAAGADFFDVSTGGILAQANIPLEPGYQVPFAEHVKSAASVPVSAVGLISGPQQANEIVVSGKADAVMLARAMLRNPHFALQASIDLGVEIDYWPDQYLRAR